MSEHKGGVAPPQYLYEMALARVEDLMVQAFPPKVITAKMIDEGFTDSPDTVKKWRNAVQKRWATEDAELRPARKDLWRARLEAQYHQLLEKAKTVKSEFAYASIMAEATRIAKVAIVLDGLTQPVVANADGKLDPAAMSPAEREREIAELIAKREAALKARAGTPGSN